VINILSCFSGEEHLLLVLQDRQDVLTQAVSLLVSMVKEEGQTGVNSSPKHGWSVKRDLVRLIGNLCYKNEPNQHLVREKEGIPAILSTCNIDDLNPFIRECAVFAIRNLCEGNIENQALISQLERHDMTDK
jgi:ataxin-10